MRVDRHRPGRGGSLARNGAPSRAEAGFTLLELMISLSLLGFMMAMTYSVFWTATQNVPRGEEMAERTARLRVASDMLSRQIHSVVNYPAMSDETEVYPFFRGGPDWVTFVTAAPQGRGGEGLGWVTYWLKGRSLMVSERMIFSVDSIGDPETLASSEAVLLEGVSGLSLEYLRLEGVDPDAREWVGSWDGAEEQSMPAAIRLLVKGAGPTGSEWLQEIPIMVVAYGLGNESQETEIDDDDDGLPDLLDPDAAPEEP